MSHVPPPGTGSLIAPRALLIAAWLLGTSAAPAEPVEHLSAPAAAWTAAIEGTLEEILVTAQRRAERPVDVPITITSVSGNRLERDGITTLDDVAREVPGLRFDAEGANVEPTIRGVGTQLTGPGLKPNVPIYVDGYYVPTELATNFRLLGIAGIDVLKEPQGTLFGRSATGGAVLVTTLDPTFNRTLTLRASDGAYAKRDVDLYATGRVTDTVAVNVAAYWQRGDGYVRDINTGSTEDGAFKNWEVRSKVLFKPSETFDAILAYDHAVVDDPSLLVTSLYDGLTSASVIPGVRIARGPWDTSQGFLSSHRETENAVRFTARLDLSFARLSSYSQYRTDRDLEHMDSDSTAAPIFTSIYAIADDTLTQEFHLTSTPGGRFSWIAGLYFYRNTEIYNPYADSLKGGPITVVFATDNLSRSYAGFADGTYEIGRHFFLTAGVRYTKDQIFEYFDLYGARSANAENNFFNVSPRGVLRYEIGERSNLYASYTQGYKAGALPAASFSTTPLQPETIKAYEVGYKYAGERLRFESSAFYYDYKNIQVSAFVGFSSVDTNAAKSTIYGADAHFSAQITAELNLDIGGAYTHSAYDSYLDASGYVQNLNPASRSYGLFNSATVGVAGAIFNATGRTLPRSPQFTSSVALNYRHQWTAGVLELTAADYYTTKVYFDPVNQFSQNSYSLLNLRAGFSPGAERWTLAVYGTNVTNTAYRNQVLPGSFGIRQSYGPPAEVGGSVSYHF